MRFLYGVGLAVLWALACRNASAAALTPGNLVLVSGQSLIEVAPSGAEVQRFTIPLDSSQVPGAHHVAVTPSGRVAVLQSRSVGVWVSLLDPVTGTWQHVTHPLLH